MQLAVAYGCGRWRPVETGHGTWNQRWWGAIDYLARRAISPAIQDANQWLADHLPGYPRRTPEDTLGDATRLARMLLVPQGAWPLAGRVQIACNPDHTTIESGSWSSDVPPGAKFVFQVTDDATLRHRNMPFLWKAETRVVVLSRDDDTWLSPQGLPRVTLDHWESAVLDVKPPSFLVWECTCGHHRCVQRHRLESWNVDDDRVTLWSFVASAVKGPSQTIRTGSFPQGMYFAFLAKENF